MNREPRVLMLGKGWFPDQLGGLDRMYRGLFEELPPDAVRGVVIGPATNRPVTLSAASRHEDSLLRRIRAYYRAASRLAAEADVVDSHFALYACALTLSGPLKSQPWVVHFQGSWAAESMTQGDASRWRYRMRRALERRVYGHADRLIVLSAAFKRVLVEQYGVQPWKVSVIPPGVDREEFRPGDRLEARRVWGLDEEAFVAICVRRLVPRMGIGKLLHAWHLALDDGLPPDSRLIIAGDGPLKKELAGEIAALDIADSASIAGRVDDDRLISLYRSADVNVVPTLEQEGFGLIVLEAAACGTPTIATSTGGLREALAGLDQSLLVPPGDSRALANRILAARGGNLPGREQTRAYSEPFGWDVAAARRRDIYRAARNGEDDRRVKVVYLDHVAQLSGGELALLRLLSHAAGVDPHVIVFEMGPLVGKLQEAGISVEVVAIDPRVGSMRKERVVPGGFSPRSIWAVVAHAFRLTRRLRQLEPDLVHTNSLKAGMIGGPAAKIAGVPVVWHLRDRLADDYLPRRAAALTRWWIRTFASRVIANSRETESTVHLRPASRRFRFTTVLPEVSVVPSAIASVTPRARGKLDRFTVGMTGRLSPWKGQDIFLRAFAAAFPNGNERAVIVGSAMFGEEAYASRLEDLAAELGISKRVRFRGFVEDVASELATFDVAVHASTIPEPFGQVVLEAFAAGVPIVAADAGGPQEMIEDGRDGLLYPPGDAQALTAALRRLRADADLRRRLVAAGEKRLDEFRPDKVFALLLRTYEATIKAD